MEERFVKITAIISESYFEELMNGQEPFNSVEWEVVSEVA